MNIVLSPEAQAKAERIPDIAQRLERIRLGTVAGAANAGDSDYRKPGYRRKSGLSREGHWLAIGQLPADFDLERFIDEQREQRIPWRPTSEKELHGPHRVWV